MRFNSKELEVIAKDNTGVTKEGLLWMKDKEGFLGKEVYQERWFRLKGNLLFYFKAKTSVPLGVIVLERSVIANDGDSERDYAFFIKFEGDEPTYYLAAKSEDEMEEWMDVMRHGSIERLKRKLEELRKQITHIAGKDPFPESMVLTSHPAGEEDIQPDGYPITPLPEPEDTPLLEIAITCSDLRTSKSELPNSVVEVSTMLPPGTEWIKHSRTEIIEQNKDPYFLTTIVFPWGYSISQVTRIKLSVYDVTDIEKEEMSLSLIGHAVCSIREILQSDQNLHLTLKSFDSSDFCGVITISGCLDEGRSPGGKFDLTLQDDGGKEFTVMKKRNSVSRTRHYLGSIIQRSYRFPTVIGAPVKVVDMMAECILTYSIPLELLKIFVAEERKKILELHNLGDLTAEWEVVRNELSEIHYNMSKIYTENYNELKLNQGLCFKKSSDKGLKSLSMVATNLHLQKLKVIDGTGIESVYDIITFGAPAAHWMKFKQGAGLRRLLMDLQEAQSQRGGENENRAGQARKARVELENLKGLIFRLSEKLKEAAKTKNKQVMVKVVESINEKVQQLLKFCSSTFMTDVLVSLDLGRALDVDEEGENGQEGKPDVGKKTHVSKTQMQQDLHALVCKCMVCANAKVDALVNGRHGGSVDVDWFEEMIPVMLDLTRSVESLIKKLLHVGLIFILMQEEYRHKDLINNICIRRDAVFSQALTALISGFVSKLYSSFEDSKYLEQITELGFLAMFESLLSTHGDENGMLDDMSMGIRDLQIVKFRITSTDKGDQVPEITGTRAGITVTVPIAEVYFNLLPHELQRGHRCIRTVPVLFSQGVNEMAAIAEMFGDTTLQEIINTENMSILNFYYEQYRAKYPLEVESGSQSLSSLMKDLHSNIVAKKSRNIDILCISEEIGWKMNAARFTSCKSAKDRTAMSVTAEQCLILQREHKMDAKFFQQALNAMRSQGTRRENTVKNTGSRLYAFSFLQRKALPKLYQPPAGTYGKNVQT